MQPAFECSIANKYFVTSTVRYIYSYAHWSSKKDTIPMSLTESEADFSLLANLIKWLQDQVFNVSMLKFNNLSVGASYDTCLGKDVYGWRYLYQFSVPHCTTPPLGIWCTHKSSYGFQCIQKSPPCAPDGHFSLTKSVSFRSNSFSNTGDQCWITWRSKLGTPGTCSTFMILVASGSRPARTRIILLIRYS